MPPKKINDLTINCKLLFPRDGQFQVIERLSYWLSNEVKAMQFQESGLGLFGWYDNDIAIFGGKISNRAHPAGHLWCKFVVYDMAHRHSTGGDRAVGSMELLIEYPVDETAPLLIRKLQHFEIDKDLRHNPRNGHPGEGLGRRSIEALCRSISDDIEILDIDPSARGFWEKMGVEICGEQKSLSATLKPALTLEREPNSPSVSGPRP
jgi:hypothetical protein